MLRALLDELDGIVAPRGRHRPGRHRHAPRQHRRRAAGDARRRGRRRACRVVNHDARDDASLSASAGTDDGVPVLLNREWVEADVRITTGFVEPHFFAGFSGGPKMVAPGLAGLETVLTLHDAPRIGDPRRDLGPLRGQPGARRHPRGRRARSAGRLRVRRAAQRRAADDPGRSRGELFAMHAAARDVVAASWRCSAVAAAVRRRRDHELRLPARPEPLPGGEGHVGRRARRAARRHDRLRRRVPRRPPRPRLVPRGAGRASTSTDWWRCSRDPARDARCPTSGRCRCRPGSSPRRACVSALRRA